MTNAADLNRLTRDKNDSTRTRQASRGGGKTKKKMIPRTLARSVARLPAGVRSQKRDINVASELYNKVWKKSTSLYVTYIVVGCVVLEGVYGTVTSSIWDSANKGVRFSYFILFMFILFVGVLFFSCPASLSSFISW